MACASGNNANHNNLAHLYQQEGVVLKPMFSIFQNSETEATITFQASSDQLLYKVDESDQFQARFSAHYEVYDNYEFETLLDSATILFTDTKKSQENKIFIRDFKLATGHIHQVNPVVKIVLTDLNRKLSYHNFLTLELGDGQNRQDFLLKSRTGRIRFMNHVMINEKFILENNANAKNYIVRQYNRNFPIATPPYVESKDMQFKYDADKKFVVNSADTFSFAEPGFYHFQLNEQNKEGFTVYVFHDEYPFITHRNQMVEPLRYLTSQGEYDVLTSQNTPDSLKFQVDKFWLKSAGSVTKGKDLVRSYYNRIQDANIFFTSYLEGWKTDRGIVYAVLGPPSKVTRNLNTETWVYGNEVSSLEMIFTFVKVYNPFSENDFALAKLNKFRYPWGQAIDAWRHGTAYGLKEIIREQDERDQQIRMANPPYSWN
jgi:GWxTD domain-containing protein